MKDDNVTSSDSELRNEILELYREGHRKSIDYSKKLNAMKFLVSLMLISLGASGYSQNTMLIKDLEPPKDFENIYVQLLSSDSMQTSFVIWVKEGVRNHFHAEHTENIYVLEGKAEMTVGDSTFIIRKGDYITVAKGIHHAVTKVYGRKPLKVLSIQSPRFNGDDRFFVN